MHAEYFFNIFLGSSYNFNKQSWFFVTTQGVPYDYDSIMHYRSNAFSRNGNPTILPTDQSISFTPGSDKWPVFQRPPAHCQSLLPST